MQAPGMASYKLRRNGTLTSPSESAEPQPQRLASTRLPMRKPGQNTPQLNTPTQQISSKLTKRRPSNTAENASSGRTVNARDGMGINAPQGKSGKVQARQISYSSPNKAAKDSVQPSTIASSSRFAHFEGSSVRTPSLISGSSTSTTESPKSNVLRRKPSSIGRSASRLRKASITSQDDTAVMDTLSVLSDPFPDSILGVALPATTTEASKQQYFNLPMTFPTQNPEQMLNSSRGLADVIAPPTPLYALSTTPSTGYSGSPGPFSIASTPTSMSSYSPATTVTSKALSRVAQSSPVKSRPPVTRRRTEESEDRALSSVRESSASSSSSTARASSIAPHVHTHQLYPLNARPRTSYDRKAEKTAMDARPRTAMPPPELAHLVHARPLQQIENPSARPSRPSREGMSDFLGARDPSPVVQNNLQTAPAANHRRQSSHEAPGHVSASAPVPGRPRIVPPSKLPSRNPSPSPSQMSLVSPTSSRPPIARGMTPDQSSDTDPRVKKGIAPTQSPAKSGSRFGFFRRKTEPATASSGSDDKKSRKGPAAGTGHEGYGKYGLARGRSGSTTSGGSGGGRSPSADSGTGSAPRTMPSRKSSVASKGAPEMDDFLRERLAPVALRGEGPITPAGQQLATPAVATENAFHTDPVWSAEPSAVPTSASSSLRPVLEPRQTTQLPRGSSPIKRDRSAPPQASSSGRFGFRSLGGKRLSRVSVTADVANQQKSPSLATQAALRPLKVQPEMATASQKLAATTSAKSNTLPLAKPPGKLTRKWNFFQRSQTAPIKEAPRLEPSPDIQPQASTRSIAHYALPEEAGKIDLDELEQIMQEANESPDEMESLDAHSEIDPDILLLPEEADAAWGPVVLPDDGARQDPEALRPLRADHVRSILLPDRPLLPPPGFEIQNRPASPKVHLRRESPDRILLPAIDRVSPILTTVLDAVDADEQSPVSPLVAMPPQRQPRLQQVGRIPQVKRDRERKLSVHSFSRPFGNNGSPAVQQQSPPIGSETPQLPSEDVTGPPALNDVVAQLRIHSFADDLETAFELKRHSSTTATTIDATVADGIEDFLAFPPRKDSDISVSTSSGHPSLKTLIATAPATFRMSLNPMEDEVWREYDDLIDDVLTSSNTSGRVACKRPTPLNLIGANTSGRAAAQVATNRRPSNATLSPAGRNSTTTRLLPSLPTVATPISPYSVTDFLNSYGAKGLSTSTMDTTIQSNNAAAGMRDSTASTYLSLPSSSQPTSTSQPATSQATTSTSSHSGSMTDKMKLGRPRYLQGDNDDTSDCETSSSVDEEEFDASSMAKIRFGALMTSKWLSFGRVLFSPVHSELKDPREDRVLVVDGLGKDWSHYVALTYQNASIYSLGPEPSAFPSTQPGASGGPIGQMPNHRHIYHPHLNAPFPFPKGFFAAVVFRFPVIASEAAYRVALAESKRVLRPGGYLEVSVLDMDPVNMGNQARRALKLLKMRLAQQYPDRSLKPMSDVAMKLVGRRGFEGLQRCILGVPVAGLFQQSDDSRADPTSLHSPMGAVPGGNDSANSSTAAAVFSDLLRTNQQNASGLGASDMICKVGRWWYEKCYESPLLDPVPGTSYSRSIWRDEALLNECERLNTTFRLLICCAQKPTGAFRRTVSV